MKVQDLIDILEAMDPEAAVLVMTQQNWPFENSVAGVAVREDFSDSDDEPGFDDGTAPNDVFIVEGGQLRYGSKDAWDAARRR